MQTQSVLASWGHEEHRSGYGDVHGPWNSCRGIPCASTSDLILADVWALGMMFFSLIWLTLAWNVPIYSRFDQKEISAVKMNLEDSSVLYCAEENIPYQMKSMKLNMLPCGALEEVYKGCVNFNQQKAEVAFEPLWTWTWELCCNIHQWSIRSDNWLSQWKTILDWHSSCYSETWEW